MTSDTCCMLFLHANVWYTYCNAVNRFIAKVAFDPSNLLNSLFKWTSWTSKEGEGRKKKKKKLEKKGAATPSVSLRVLARVGKPDSERHLYTKFGRTSGNSRKSRE